MPDLNDGLQSHQIANNNFGFSGERIDELDASEYTLVTIAVDTSLSTKSFRSDMIKTVDAAIEACSKSPRKDNLMIRMCEFNSRFNEIHGFKKLSTISKGDYDSEFGGTGSTALYDATENAVAATDAYAKNLADNDFQVNGIVFVITDGQENSSAGTINTVKGAFKSTIQNEHLESLVSILLGVNADSSLNQYLTDFKSDAGFTQYESIKDATPSSLAKFAEFMSKSVSAQSSSLGTGGPSQPLAF